MSFLPRLRKAASDGIVADAWLVAVEQIARDRSRLLDLIDQGMTGYGVSRMVGHRDQELIEPRSIESFQIDLLASHQLPGSRWADRAQARAVLASKAQLLSLGGSGISPEVYQAVLDAVADDTFVPPIPLGASYSSGDVIPGAWLARAVLDRSPGLVLGAKDGLSLINGVHVHAGCALVLHDAASSLFACLRELAAATVVAGDAKRDPFEVAERRGLEALDRSSEALGPRWAPHRMSQDPVAIRATPEVMEALELCLASLARGLESVLAEPSDNPLVGESGLLEQASFLSPRLAVETSALTESLLLATTWVERSIHWLADGAGGTVPRDLSEGTELGLIQAPKLATAIGENVRLRAARRVFASGSSTSHGIEDLWTNGIHAVTVAEEVLQSMVDLMALLAATLDRACELGAPRLDSPWVGVGGPTDFRSRHGIHLSELHRRIGRPYWVRPGP